MFDRIRRAHTTLRRATAGPLLVRGGVLLTGLAALVTAFPAEVAGSRYLILLLVAAALPAMAPRRWWPSAAILLAVAGWLLSTLGYGEPVTALRLLALASWLYLLHSLAALAAQLPSDAVLAPEVLARWIGRALGVLAASAVFTLVLLLAVDRLRGAHQAATAAGIGVAAGVAALLAWLAARRRSGG